MLSTDTVDHATSRRTNRIRVLCVDDHRVMLDGLALLIGRQPDMEVIASATNGEQAVELFSSLLPDITLMDLQLPTMSGSRRSQIRSTHPDARIVVLTMYQGDEDIYRALEAGATAYLLKDTLAEDLVTVIRDVHTGNSPIPAGRGCRARGTQSAAVPYSAGDRGREPHHARAAEQGNRRHPWHQRTDRQGPCEEHPRETACQRSLRCDCSRRSTGNYPHPIRPLITLLR